MCCVVILPAAVVRVSSPRPRSPSGYALDLRAARSHPDQKAQIEQREELHISVFNIQMDKYIRKRIHSCQVVVLSRIWMR